MAGITDGKETARITQRGGPQTINASGHAKVKGNRMIGSSNKMIINNYPSGASTSRGHGKKRKAAGSKTKSSSGKKKAKRDAVDDEEESSEDTVDDEEESSEGNSSGTKRKVKDSSPGPSTRNKKKKIDDTNVTDDVIENLAEDIGINKKLSKLGGKLGFGFPAMAMYDAKNHAGGDVTSKGTKQMLIDWRVKVAPGKSSILKKALIDAGLALYADKYFKGRSPSGSRPKRQRNVEEEDSEDSEESSEDGEEEESEADEESSEDDEEEESEDNEAFPEETVRINQRGGAQTINASGHAKVKGNRMTGSSSKVIIYTNASGASTSRDQGKKRKATGSKTKSSSGKKKAKRGDKK